MTKTLLLKILCSLVAEHRGIKLALNWKLPPCLLVFIITEDTWKLLQGNKISCLTQLWPTPATIHTCQTEHGHRCIMTWLLWEQTNNFLISVGSCFVGGEACLLLQTWSKVHGVESHRPYGEICYSCFSKRTCCQNAFLLIMCVSTA